MRLHRRKRRVQSYSLGGANVTCALIGATRPVRLNLSFFRFTQVHILTANQSVQPFLHSSWQSCQAYPGMSFPLRIAPLHEGSGLHLIHASLRPPEFITQMASGSFQLFCTAHGRLSTFYNAPPFPRLKLPLPVGRYARFLGPIRAHNPNGFSIGSAIFAQFSAVSLYFTMGRPFPQNCPFPWRICTPSNTWFLGPTRVLNPNGISIG